MKYLLVIFAALVLSLFWLSEKYKNRAKELEAAKQQHAMPHSTPAASLPAAKKIVQPEAAKPPVPATVTKAGSNTEANAAATLPPATAAANPASSAAAPVAATTAATSPAGAVDPNKPPPPPKDWQQICYNASMQAEHAMRRRMDGALAAEVTNIGNQTDPEYRDNLQGVMNQVNTTPVTSDFAQQQLEMDNIKSSTYNNCMAGHR